MPDNEQTEGADAADGRAVVLHVVSGISAEGIGTFVLNVLEHVDRSRTKVLFAMATEWEQLHERRVRELGADVYRTAEIGAGPAGWVKHFVRLIRLIRRHGGVDVVHSHMDRFNGINCLAAWLARVPIRISHAHKSAESGGAGWLKRLYSLTMRLLIACCATERIGCSVQANEAQHRIGPWRFKSRVVASGIDMSRFSRTGLKAQPVGPEGSDGPERPAGLDLREGEIRFVAVGRMDEEKNPLFLLRVFHEVKKRRADVRLYWIGTGSLRGEVEALITELGLESSASLLGIRSDVADILPWMDYMLFPSKREGLGLAVIEAQACGVTCFVSDAVPAEADIGLSVVLPLARGEGYWAERICERLEAGSNGLALDPQRADRYDIRRITRELEAIWRPQRGKSRRGGVDGGVGA